MKDPDDPIEDLDQTTLNMFQSNQNALFHMNMPQSSRNPQNFLEQNDYGNIGLKMYESVRPQEQEEVGQCCQSAILLIECVHSYLQLMKYMTPIGYEIFLEVQKIIEFYFYQTFTLFIEKQKIDELINTQTDVHKLSNTIYNIEKQLNELAPFHENLLTYLPYKELRNLLIKCMDYFESESDHHHHHHHHNQINNSLSQTQYNLNRDNINQIPQNNIYDCNRDMNIFTLSCANNNYQMNNVYGNTNMQSSVNQNKIMNGSHMHTSIMTESSQIRRQKLMIQFDLQQRLSSVQSIYTLNKYLQLVQGQIIQYLSLIDTTSSVSNFVTRIIEQEIQNYLKQMKNFIIRDYCKQQLDKENIFQDFSTINWRPGDYTIDTQKPLYIENSLFFLKEFKQKIETEQYQNNAKKPNGHLQLSPTIRLDIYRNMLEAWMQIFLKNISSIKKYSDKGRSKLFNHYLMFIREIDQLLPIGHLKVQNDTIEKYIKIWNTTSPQELLQFISSMKNQIPLLYLISITSSNDKLTLLLSSQRQFDTIHTLIYKEFLQFVIENN